MRPCVYILASERNGTLYVGVTGSLQNRVALHKQDLIEGFTKRYGVHRLQREKRLKKWNRAWKLRLIEQMNPEWHDLFNEYWGAICSGPVDLGSPMARIE